MNYNEIITKLKNDGRFSVKDGKVIRKEGSFEYVYDRHGILIEETYADGSKDVYDKHGILIEKTYPDGSKDVYKRDKQGILIEKTYPDGSKDVYDKHGILIEKTCADGRKYVYAFGIMLEM